MAVIGYRWLVGWFYRCTRFCSYGIGLLDRLRLLSDRSSAQQGSDVLLCFSVGGQVLLMGAAIAEVLIQFSADWRETDIKHSVILGAKGLVQKTLAAHHCHKKFSEPYQYRVWYGN